MNYMRNTQTGEIRPVEADSPEFLAMKGQVAANGVTPLWEQTSDAAAVAIAGRAAEGATHESDLGAEHQSGVAAEFDTSHVSAEDAPYRNLTPAEIKAGLTPERKRAEVEDELAVAAPDHASGEEAILAGADVSAEKQAAVEQLEGEQAHGGSDDGETVDSLKDKLREAGLPVSGNKAELQARLAEHEASQSGGSGDDDDDHEGSH